LKIILPKVVGEEDESLVAPVRKRLEIFGIMYCLASKEEKAKALYNII
jgi:hypothetical protein